MINLKDLKDRHYEGVRCVSFAYDLEYSPEEGEKSILEVRFYKTILSGSKADYWTLMAIFPRTNDSDSQIYNITYCMPKPNMTLMMVAATGLNHLKYRLKSELNNKMSCLLSIDDVMEGIGCE